MQESKLREILNARQATTTGEVSFESTADDMKRIIEYAKKKNTQGLKARGSVNLIANRQVLQEPQHHFELVLMVSVIYLTVVLKKLIKD